MAGGPRLELRQGQYQSLVMTTQLQQSIKLLQLSSVELAEFVATELEENPFLTRDEANAEAAGSESESDRVVEQENANKQESTDGDEDRDWGTDKSGDHQEMLDAPEEAFWDDAMGSGYEASAGASSGGSGSGSSGDYLSEILEQTLSQEKSLPDHLLEQLNDAVLSTSDRMIGVHLIDLIDDRGYVVGDLDALAEQLHCSKEEIEAVLKEIQTFDPSGVGARDLVECLAIQLRDRDQLDPAMEKMLAHLDLVADGNFSRLAWVCGVEEEDIPFMLKEVQELNPKPGYQFSSEATQTVIPDVLLRRTSGGGWQVELNPDALPRVLVNQRYFSQLSGKTRAKSDKKYITDQVAHANWLVKALDQRAQTILKVATEIVKQQDAFFRKGIRHLRPLTLKDIAAEVEVHESTVSRVTTQKYLSTGTAVYELKYFFSSSLGSVTGAGEDALSSEAVKDMIKELIEQEEPKKILSDDKLAELLQDKGVDIARRTVAKYREAMDIPSSTIRRREKKRLL